MELIVTKLIIDVVMAVLLFGTIWYCRRLDLRIKILQDSKGELAKVVKRFDDSTEKAALCIGEIHKVSQRIHENMRHHMDKANFLAGDLSYMIERGNKVVGAIPEKELEELRERGKPATQRKERRAAKAESAGEAKPASRSQEATPIQGGRRREDLAIEDQSIKDDTKKIERMLTALSEHREASEAVEQEIITPDQLEEEKPGAVKLRSKAEQELYEALRNQGQKGESA